MIRSFHNFVLLIEYSTCTKIGDTMDKSRARIPSTAFSEFETGSSSNLIKVMRNLNAERNEANILDNCLENTTIIVLPP
jgi:hypothetical protein